VVARELRHCGSAYHPDLRTHLGFSFEMSESQNRRLRWSLATVSALGLGLALFSAFSSGVSFHIGAIPFSARDASRPLAVGVLAGAAAIWLFDRRSGELSSWERLIRWSGWLAAVIAVLTMIVGIHFGIFVASGADAYGYVTEASLLANLHLRMPEPLMAVVPSLGSSVAPLGYRPGTIAGTIVPVYSPGLPLLMAIALKVGGQDAVYYVVPVLGCVCVWLTYVMGSRIAGPRTGLMAAALLACSPTFLLQLIEPMSDVPVTGWWLAALILAMAEGKASSLSAGACATMALLTRPNLLPLALWVGMVVVWKSSRISRGLLFVAGLLPGCLAIALVNRFLYGSPLASGYGSLDTLFQWARLGANLRRYPLWLLQLHSAFIFFALAAPFTTAKKADAAVKDRGVIDPVVAWLLLGFCGVLLICYLFYIPYDTWPFVRFLLPGIPVLLVLSSAVAMWLVCQLPITWRTATMIAVCGLLGGWCMRKAANLHIFQTAASEHRCVAVGRYVERVLPQNAVLVSVIQSGSIRLYGHRTTVRWDQLTAEQFDGALRTLRKSGYAPYILLEDWEEPEFRSRFAEPSVFGRLDWPAAAQYEGYQRVRIYSLADRSRHLAGQRITTQPIPDTN
jgi:hypothetical protein